MDNVDEVVEEIALGDTRTTTIGYDKNDQRTTQTLDGVTKGWTWDERGKLYSDTNSCGCGSSSNYYTYDGNGNLIAENDDGGQGTNSFLSFTADSSGTFYIGISWSGFTQFVLQSEC